VAIGTLESAAVLDALGRECYEARLAPSMPAQNVLDCAGIVEERTISGAPEDRNRFVRTHRLRFTAVERSGEGRLAVEAWTEVEELGSVVEQPVTSEEYFERVRRVLTAVVRGLADAASPVWLDRYDSEQAWRLDAHLKAVSYCDANLEGMTARSVEADLERIGLRALDDAARDRCEQLYTHLFEWGLARGDAEPTVAEYAAYRAALPAEQRPCAGQLALRATCTP
jgi:hypothetical protein